MTELTGHARTTNQRRRIGNMLGRFGNRCHSGKYLTIVAVGTTTHDAGVVHRRSGETARTGFARRMASLARHAGRQVVYRLRNWCHAGKYLAIVAVGTTTHNTGMVHRSAGEAACIGIARRMTSLARLTGRQVVHRLGYRRHPGKYLSIMTSRASARDTGMVHYAGVITRAIMAERTRRSRRQMIGRLGAAGRDREAGCRGMATFARSRACRGVGSRYGLWYRRNTVKGNAHVLVTMACRATTEDAGMVHHCSAKPARCRLAR